MPSILQEQLFSIAEIGVLPCSKCARPMRLSHIEPAAPSFDLRTFKCVRCGLERLFVVAI